MSLYKHTQACSLHLLLLLILILILPSLSFVNPFSIIARDFRALTQKHTTLAITSPATPRGKDLLLEIKARIRQKSGEGAYVVDAFVEEGRMGSSEHAGLELDLLGELLPQGALRDSMLDRVCFESPLGVVTGPIETTSGYNLILIRERVGCKKDGGMTRLVKVSRSKEGGEGGGGEFWESKLVGGGDEIMPLSDMVVLTTISGGVVVAGGILAELVAN